MSSFATRDVAAPLDLEPRNSPARGLMQHAEREYAARFPEPKTSGADRRGPFRPGKLVPIRARLSGYATARTFRRIDTGLVWALAFAAFWQAQAGQILSAPLGGALPYIAAGALLTWALRMADAYTFSPRETLSGHLLRIAGAFGLAGLGGLVLAVVLPGRTLTVGAGLWLGAAFSVVYLAHAGWWTLISDWRRAGKLTPNIVVVGATKNAERLIGSLLDSREANVLGVFEDRLDRAPDALCGVPVLGTTEALLGHRIMPYVDRVVIAVPAAAQGRVRQLIERLRVLPNDVSLFLEFGPDGGSVSQLANSPMAQVCGQPRDEARTRAKRLQDLLLGVVIFAAALPIMALTALAVRLDSPGPVLFRQRRHGFNNEEITVWKFRSMRHDKADATASRQVTAGDDRVTRLGRFIRKTSLDELPQILNVLKGEMSLVGPRPHAIGMKTGDTESARLVAEYAHRHRIKPGITGWAAIKGSRGPVHTPEDVRRRVALDVEYIERQSLWLDLYIIAMTLPCLLGDRSAVR